MDVQRYRARWIVPVEGEPIENGTLEIDAGGRIAALHDRWEPRAIDLGNAALLPGLVNAHTHLEFSGINTPLEPREPFTDWIRAVVAHRRVTAGRSAVGKGLIESVRSGTTSIGEIATSDESDELSGTPGPRVVAFRELLGLPADQIAPQLEIARLHLECDSAPPASPAADIPCGTSGRLESSRSQIVRGLSPHAPYSVHPDLFLQLVKLAAEHQAPLAMHLAETEAELELLDRGTGPFVDLLREFGVWREDVIPGGTRPLDYLRPMAQLDRGLVVHGNYLSDEEIAFLAAQENLTVVYCPRTHAGFRHAPHRWREMKQRGVRVALGTDSRASNPDLSLWHELCFLGEQPSADPRLLLELATLAGARALGLDDETGSLVAGKRADLAMVELNGPNATDIHRVLIDHRHRIAGTICGGEWAHRTH